MSITFIGINHKTAPSEVRERLAFSEEMLPDALAVLLEDSQIDEAVILSTCNRTEIYANISGPVNGMNVLTRFMCGYHNIPENDVVPYIYAGDDVDAANHLFNVVASLDSMVIGEKQILGQVRNAYRIAADNNATGRVLNRLFHQALSVGKGVQGKTEIGNSHVSLSTVALDIAKRVFDDLERRHVLVVGAGEMGELTTRYLVEKRVHSVTVINRTYKHAEALANQFEGRAIPFEDMVEGLVQSDIVIASTSAPSCVITADQVRAAMKKRRGRSLLLIDLAVPRDVERSCEDIDDVYVYDLDDIKTVAANNQESRRAAAQQAAALVSDGVRAFTSWMELSDAAPTIKDLRSEADAIRDAELGKLFKRLKNLDDKDQKSIVAAANAIINKLLHVPIKTVRDEATAPEGDLYVRVVRDLFNLDGENDAERTCRLSDKNDCVADCMKTKPCAKKGTL